MTVLHSALHTRTRTEVLDESARADFEHLLDRDPIVNAVVSARLQAAGVLRAGAMGGLVFGARRGSELVGACFSGGNLVPVAGDARSWEALAASVAKRSRVCTSIVGRHDAVAAMWQVLSRRWPQARTVRARQPLLVAERLPAVGCDDSVRAAGPDDLERYAAAAAIMFTEELGVSPHVSPGKSAFRRRVDELIRSGRAFGRFDFRGQVEFKADIGAITAHTCQIQGVWVRPDLRGRGVGTAALATVIRHALTLAPTVSLYVNDFNTPARRVYDKLGMREHGTLSTVLL